MRSLSRRFLFGVGITSVSITLLGSLAAFLLFRADLASRQVKHLGEYADQRLAVVSRRFGAIADIQRAAIAKLTADMDRLSPAEVERLFERDYPLQPDGTRRSRPEQFDGVVEPTGQYVAGMGAYLRDGRQVSPEEKRALVAAYHTVHEFGVGVQSSYDNLYFATPSNRVVLYAPHRPDRLMFYRKTAPASLDFSKEEMMRMIAPGANPQGETRCTSLQRLIQDTQGQRLSTACLTPVRYRGRYIGGFGSSLQMTDYMPSTVSTPVKGVTSLLVRPEGDVIAYPGQSPGEAASAPRLAQVEKAYRVRELMARIRATGRDHGVVRSPDGGQLVAFGRIPGPDWWLLMAYPEAEVQGAAARTASWVLAMGLLASLIQTALVVWLARSTIALPLQRLAASRAAGEPPADLLARKDEIGALGRALAEERAKTQAVLTSLEARVAERTAELERASSEKDRFLANMSHELRTPLNGVIAVSETLAGLQRSRRAQEMAHLIVSSSRLLEHVLSDILDFSRLEQGQVTLADEAFDLAQVLAHTAELHRAVAVGKRLSLTWSVAPEAAGWYRGDPVRLTQVVSNLLSNAVKFTERGEISLKADRTPGGAIRIAVADTGIGFDAATHARLFQRFEQADPSISRRFGGSGLGLAICRSLVDAMGGEIRAASMPGAGSVFTVVLALPRADAPSLAGDAPEAGEPALAGARVLLAEDHPTNQKVVELILQSAGVELTIVADGRAALDALKAGGFDLVLMDMQMPGLDGLSATRLWREHEALLHLPRTPVVMLTANALGEHVEASLKAGADRHLAKPIRAAELLSVVETLTAAATPGRAAA